MSKPYIEVVPGMYLTEPEFENYVTGKYNASGKKTSSKHCENRCVNYVPMVDFLSQNLNKKIYRDFVLKNDKLKNALEKSL